jgi:polyhydroxybutyrate depolymerase
MKFKIAIINLLTCLVMAPAVHAFAVGFTTHPFTHNGYSRPYLVYTPGGAEKNAAVVFVLGGVGSTATSNAAELGWTQEADRNHFVVVFPEPIATNPLKPLAKSTNVTFWEMQGSRTHILGPTMLAVDDDGYLSAVLKDVLHSRHVDRKRVFFAGFSSGSGMVQLFASRHSTEVAAIAAVATPLMEVPTRLAHPVAVLYIHGDEDEQFSGFEVNSPDFATTPHGNWVTWGYLNRCHIQRAKKTPWGVQFSWNECRQQTPVVADFVAGLDHEWLTSNSAWNVKHRPADPMDFADMAWQFFAGLGKATVLPLHVGTPSTIP